MDKISRKQRQLERKVENLKRFGAEEEKYKTSPNYYLIQKEGEEDEENLFSLDEGQCVELLDNNNPEAWLVRTKTKPPSIGFVPSYYFTTPTKYYALQRNSNNEQCSIKKLIQTEEEFIEELKLVLDYYVKSIIEVNDKEKASQIPEEVKEREKQLLLKDIELIYNFHLNTFLKELKEYKDDINTFSKTFLSLKHNFIEIHLPFLRQLENALRICQHVDIISKFLEEIHSKQSTIKPYTDYLQLIPNRIRFYEDFFKELINKTINCTEEMKKSLNFLQLIEQQAKEPDFTKLIIGYSEDVNSLGYIYRHELFNVWEDGDLNTNGGDKYIFLFNNIILITIKEEINSEILFKHYATIKLRLNSVGILDDMIGHLGEMQNFENVLNPFWRIQYARSFDGVYIQFRNLGAFIPSRAFHINMQIQRGDMVWPPTEGTTNFNVNFRLAEKIRILLAHFAFVRLRINELTNIGELDRGAVYLTVELDRSAVCLAS
ncbi:DH domain-containing protein [Meloidogyne graminicola]|uniref:DH domain-containing protein n=1 Tax=Meloidogyne graminicola TaxID=189291 RepID=A0A8S9ZTP3_9BILA|nr:DH domain-containing protein [Meloidogyne graminicola]